MGGDAESSKNSSKSLEMDNLSLDISTSRFSRDLLQRFRGNTSSSNQYVEGVVKDDDDEIELNLGLSLGGRFGVDKTKLIRSSSIASCLPIVRDDNDVVGGPPVPVSYSGLVRTSSLPVETEEEWRKRKELQSLRRMEAKRRRSEKQRSLREGGGGGGGISRGGSLSVEERKEIEVNLRGRLEREKSLSLLKRQGSSLASQQSGLSTLVNQAILRGGIDLAMGKGKGSLVGSGDGIQGSIESKMGSSSSVSDMENKTLQGSSGELSPASIQSLQEGSNQDTGLKAREHTRKTPGPEMDSSSKRPETSKSRVREAGTNALEDMPCVFTKGDGPNGRRVDGILYKYGKGEEVRIMCVCHGNFHSPAEFIAHAGGTDINNPLKHIVVNPNASGML